MIPIVPFERPIVPFATQNVFLVYSNSVKEWRFSNEKTFTKDGFKCLFEKISWYFVLCFLFESSSTEATKSIEQV